MSYDYHHRNDHLPLKGEDWMPLGKHSPRGTDPRQVKDVPLAYFEWLERQDFLYKYPRLEKYIETLLHPETAKSEPKQSEKVMDKTTLARQAILEELRRRWKAGPIPEHGITAPADISRFYQPQANYFCGAGQMPCPICRTGILKYDRNSYNGHVRARCLTSGCVAWIE